MAKGMSKEITKEQEIWKLTEVNEGEEEESRKEGI
jgi:hypothetical protein